MRIYLVAASLTAAMLLQAEVQAIIPDTRVEVVPLIDSTQFAACTVEYDVTVPVVSEAKQVLDDEPDPPRYNYRPARRTGRRFQRVVRYHRRQNRRDLRELKQESQRKRTLEKRAKVI